MRKNILILALMFVFILKIDAQTPTDSLVAFYPFNSNVNDESGNSNHGMVFGATLSTDRFGNPNNSYYFDGIDDYALFNDESFDFDSLFSISFWLKTSSTGSDQRLFHKSADSPNRGWFISLNRNETGKLTFFSSENGTDFSEFSSDSVFNDDNWNHIVFVYDGANNISKFYKNNGTAGVNTSAYANLNTNDDVLSISNSNFLNNFPEGIIDDIRIYNRVLNSTEISELFYETVCSRIIMDTTHIEVLDTITVEVFDTITVEVFDTITVEVLDTNFVTVYDSISVSVSDTLIIDINITGINPPNYLNSFKVYPNPTKDFIYIHTGVNYEHMIDYNIKIISTSGEIIFESEVDEPLFELNVGEFGKTGLYFIQIIDNASQLIDVRKLILK